MVEGYVAFVKGVFKADDEIGIWQDTKLRGVVDRRHHDGIETEQGNLYARLATV